MVMTIAELVSSPTLGTRLLAGSGGADRPVNWAHTCEVPDPWNFLSAGDLLLSDGYSFPSDPEGQVAFLRELLTAGMSGLSLGEGVEAPPVTEEALAYSDAQDFPLLETRYSVPFVMVARAVADSNSHTGARRLNRILRVYDVLRDTHARDTVDRLLDNLSDELGAGLHVVNARTGRDLLPRSRPLGEGVRTAVVSGLDPDTRKLPPIGRLQTPEGTLLVVPLVHEEGAVMLAEPGDEPPDLVVLQHAATLAGLDAGRRGVEEMRRRARGGELVRRLQDGSLSEDAGRRRLRDEGLGEGPWVAACLEGPGTDAEEGSVEALARDAEPPPHLFLRTAAHDLVILPADRADELRALVEAGEATVGVGEPFRSIAKAGDAVREARWALEAARSSGAGSAAYGERPGLFMPRTVSEGEAAVEEVLGAALAYDREKGAGLVTSLDAFFEANRSWQGAAKRLGIHKQTLVYRMQKLEELTGRNLRDFGDQSELYLALRTLRLLDLPEAPDPV